MSQPAPLPWPPALVKVLITPKIDHARAGLNAWKRYWVAKEMPR